LSVKDIYSDPKYHKNSKTEILMTLRTDSRGEPINRAIIGDKGQYF